MLGDFAWEKKWYYFEGWSLDQTGRWVLRYSRGPVALTRSELSEQIKQQMSHLRPQGEQYDWIGQWVWTGFHGQEKWAFHGYKASAYARTLGYEAMEPPPPSVEPPVEAELPCAFTAVNPSSPPAGTVPQQEGPVWQVWVLEGGKWSFSIHVAGDAAGAESIWLRGYKDVGKTSAFIELQRNPEHFWQVVGEDGDVPAGQRVCDPTQPPSPTGTCLPTQTYDPEKGCVDIATPSPGAAPTKKGSIAGPVIAVLLVGVAVAIFAKTISPGV